MLVLGIPCRLSCMNCRAGRVLEERAALQRQRLVYCGFIQTLKGLSGGSPKLRQPEELLAVGT